MKKLYIRLVISLFFMYIFFTNLGCTSKNDYTEKWKTMKTDYFTISLPTDWTINKFPSESIYDYVYVVNYAKKRIFEINVISNGGSEDFLVPLHKWEYIRIRNTDYYYLSFDVLNNKGIAFKARTDFEDSNNLEVSIFVEYIKENVNLKKTINTAIKSLRVMRPNLYLKPPSQDRPRLIHKLD